MEREFASLRGQEKRDLGMALDYLLDVTKTFPASAGDLARKLIVHGMSLMEGGARGGAHRGLEVLSNAAAAVQGAGRPPPVAPTARTAPKTVGPVLRPAPTGFPQFEWSEGDRLHIRAREPRETNAPRTAAPAPALAPRTTAPAPALAPRTAAPAPALAPRTAAPAPALAPPQVPVPAQVLVQTSARPNIPLRRDAFLPKRVFSESTRTTRASYNNELYDKMTKRPRLV